MVIFHALTVQKLIALFSKRQSADSDYFQSRVELTSDYLLFFRAITSSVSVLFCSCPIQVK
jgi:hypothetical protein